MDGSGDLYIADNDNNEVEEVTPDGTLSVVAGTGTGKQGAPVPGPATSSDLWGPTWVALDGDGDMYIADSLNDEVEKVTAHGTLSVVAGRGTASTTGTSGQRTGLRGDGP